MADVWVRLPLGALKIRTWDRYLPVIPYDHGFGLSRADQSRFRCGQTVRQRPVKPTSEGSIPSTGASIDGRASQLAMAAASKAVERDKRLDGFDSLTFR